MGTTTVGIYNILTGELVTNIIVGVLTGSIAATIVGYVLNKRLYKINRTEEKRKELYTEINETMSAFLGKQDAAIRYQAAQKLIKLNSSIQLWASPDIIKQFNVFLFCFDIKNKQPQEKIDFEYKKLVCHMHKDLTGENLNESDVTFHIFNT